MENWIHIPESWSLSFLYIPVNNNTGSISSVTPNLTKAADILILHWQKDISVSFSDYRKVTHFRLPPMEV